MKTGILFNKLNPKCTLNLKYPLGKRVCFTMLLAASSQMYAMSDEAFPTMEMSTANSTLAQQNQINVTGTVTDVNNEPLIGVNVKIKGTATGTITDFDGKFALETAKGAVLEISYVGYKSKEVKVVDGKPLSVILTEDTEVLSEVVVTALGIKKEAKSLSYNVQQVDNSEITRVADANFVNNLNGKIAGVTINSSSSGVGGSSRVVMRGAKSLNGNNNALYVVDGIPMLDMSLPMNNLLMHMKVQDCPATLFQD